ncbi:hypothetical protein [Arcobacter sp. L]|uniref:hypothetical protein n=1 Tax=Arcobacter sp. L TaxID=944547 RepID=UPI0002295F5F|nr:hypothetical protein [Arcobacter sp. L]BAK72807.1 hypothetical protein ABLL_0932 [Arcobacter sp. L]
MKQKRKFIDYFDSVFEKNKNNELIVYKKSSFYPCVQIEVITVEKSREDMGILEMTILKLIKLGISDIEQIAKLTGFNKPDKLHALIDEMIGYGMIELKNNKLFISEIGKESISCGHQMIATRTSLLLCGITGKLLQKAMYGAKRVEVDELSSCIGFKYLIDEKPTISLESLNLKGIDKRKYNIKDEVDYISEYLDYTQVFLEADITIYKTTAKNYLPEISINKEKVDWAIDSKQLLSEISIDTTKLSDLAFNFKTYFSEFGFNDIQVKDKEFNCVEIECSSILSKTIKSDFNGHPLLAYIGSFSNSSNQFEYMPIPINKLPFPQKKDTRDKKLAFLIQGQMMYLTTTSKEILTKALIYRKLYEIRYDFFKIPYDERDKKFNEYFNEKVSFLEFDEQIIQDIIDNYLSQRYKKMIHKGDDE